MEFHQKPDAEQGAQTHHVARVDVEAENFSTSHLRDQTKSGHVNPLILSALGALDALLKNCHFKEPNIVFRDGLRRDDVDASLAALELIRRQSYTVRRALGVAESQQVEWLREELRRMLEQEEEFAE